MKASISPLLIIVIVTYLFGRQHYQNFVQSNELKKNEKALKNLYRQADERSKIDSLTQIFNRGHFLDLLEEKILLARKNKIRFYLILLDVDNFKDINDTHGHPFGDMVLERFAQELKTNVRSDSYLGRYGGDEFLIMIDEVPQDALLKRLEMIQISLSLLRFDRGDQDVNVAASFGVACFNPEATENGKDLLLRADQALRDVNRTQRGKIKISS